MTDNPNSRFVRWLIARERLDNTPQSEWWCGPCGDYRAKCGHTRREERILNRITYKATPREDAA